MLMDYVSTRTIKHIMVQLRAAVLGKYNKSLRPRTSSLRQEGWVTLRTIRVTSRRNQPMPNQ
ncbi:hypothetical protein DAI22_06g153400 [Oryza sativa Japonica Group]|nr:hypothetical protein DAI22_06g153400 [Oryza sativa Japonica Group]